mmetsp:Transcript_61922/g.144111  ORF Transcript_61922/g.144111 Transcript_61922/m.144111 type:complete len:228 (-) Transcript_61922:422-1105(-)
MDSLVLLRLKKPDGVKEWLLQPVDGKRKEAPPTSKSAKDSTTAPPGSLTCAGRGTQRQFWQRTSVASGSKVWALSCGPYLAEPKQKTAAPSEKGPAKEDPELQLENCLLLVLAVLALPHEAAPLLPTPAAFRTMRVQRPPDALSGAAGPGPNPEADGLAGTGPGCTPTLRMFWVLKFTWKMSAWSGPCMSESRPHKKYIFPSSTKTYFFGTGAHRSTCSSSFCNRGL